MTRARWILLFSLVFLIVIATWLWWAKPGQSDLSNYAPATALLYVECNRPTAVAEAVAATEAWRQIGPQLGFSIGGHSGWTQRLVAWTGIGPIESVLLARSQVAVVVTNLTAAEEGEALRIKPEAAVIIDTHTSSFRIRGFFQKTLQRFAERTYVKPVFSRTILNDLEFMEWASPDGSRQIMAAVRGGVVVIGNNRKVVQECFETSTRGSGLTADPELNRLRAEASPQSLTFGYVPAQNSATLLSVGLPIVLGRAPGDADFQRLVSTSAAKLFGSLSWSSRLSGGGIEDRYYIALRPQVLAQLRSSSFGPLREQSQATRLPDASQSATYYRFEQPLAAWQGLKTTVSSQVDALSAVVFSAVLKSSLINYGIEQPELFLPIVAGEILTVRNDDSDERNLLVARPANADLARRYITEVMKLSRDPASQVELYRSSQTEFAAAIMGNFMAVGHATEVAEYVATPDKGSTSRMTKFASSPSDAQIVTLTEDSDRVRGFVSAILALTRSTAPQPAALEQKISGLPFAVTETTFTSDGLVRVTRSPLGQFSTLLPLIVPEQPESVNSPSPSR